MHEMPIVMEILERAIELAKQHGATRIKEIEVQLGAMHQVLPEALQMAFQVARHGTLAERAALIASEEAVVAVCNECEQRFEPEIGTCFACPRCGQADLRIVAGDDIILRSVTLETDQDPATS